MRQISNGTAGVDFISLETWLGMTCTVMAGMIALLMLIGTPMASAE